MDSTYGGSVHARSVPFISPVWLACCTGIVGAAILLGEVNADATGLRLRFKDDDGRAVRPSSAELLLVAWGDAVRLNLETGVLETSYGPDRHFLREGTTGLKLALGAPLLLPLDFDWLHSRWPERFRDMSGVYLYLKADGYAAIRSEKFLWIGSHGPPFGPRVNDAEIRFPGRKAVIVQEGQDAEYELVFRRPTERFIRLVDDDGMPVSGAKVSSYMFWSDENHCGTLSGADPVGHAESDRDGRVQVPDGDYQYAFEFEKDRYVLDEAGAKPILPPRLITYLTKPETTMRMHRWRRRPLEMEVTENGVPSPGLVVGGCLTGCPCGACCGQLAYRSFDKNTPTETDGNGKFQMTDFYPEEFDRVYLVDGTGKEVWAENPRKWPPTGIIRVVLPK